MEQLRARDGVVRCGRCDNVFNADSQLFSDVPSETPQHSAPKKKARSDGNTKPKSAKPKTTSPEKRSTKKPIKLKTPTEEVAAAPPPWTPPPIPIKSTRQQDPIVSEKLVPTESPDRRFSTLWSLGAIFLAASLAMQCVYFYRDQFAAYPVLRPYLEKMCASLACRVQSPYDVSRIELVQPTSIAPHPRIANALRLRATLVNRAENVQAYPYMQITLTDNTGRVLARRVFSPPQYLEQRTAPGGDMPSHLAIGALIDITNPDGKAVGYQIDFLPPPS
jgi:hypothetical protein